MATARKKVVELLPPAEPEETPEYVDFQTLNPALDAIKAELGITGDADATCHVSKLDADGKGNDYKVWVGNPEDFNLETLAKKHGSGQFRIMVYVKNPASGHKVRQINTVQAWQLSPEDEARLEAARHPQEAKAQDNSAVLVGVMTQGFQQLGELIVKASAQPAGPDPLTMIEKLGSAMRAMMPPAPVPQGPGLMEMLNMVKLFNEATGANAPKLPADTDASTALMMAGMDMFKPVIAKAVEQRANAAPVAGVAPAAAPQALPAPEPVQSEPENEEFMLFKLTLKQANKQAAAGGDPADFADKVYDMLPDGILTGMATDPLWFSYLVKAVPECEAHKAWYEGVRAALVDIAIEDGVFVRGADGTLTLAPEPAQNPANDPGKTPDAAGTSATASTTN